MRITQTMMANKYTSRVSNSLANLDYVNRQVGTGRQFFKGSENPAGAAKAYKLRRQASQIDDYTNNTKDLLDALGTRESVMMQVQKSLEDAYKTILGVMNGPQQDPDIKQIAAQQLRAVQKNIVQDMNSKYGDRYLFGGSCVSEAPFELYGNTLKYRGVDVSGYEDYTYPADYPDPSLAGTTVKGLNSKNPPAEDGLGVLKLLKSMSNEAIYIDLGFGLEFNGANQLNASTAFNSATAGINVLGFNTESDFDSDYPENIVCLLGKMASVLESNGSQATFSSYLDKFKTERQGVLNSITKCGSDYMFLNYTSARLENMEDNIDAKISNTEHVDEEAAIMNLNTMDYMYQALLKTSNKILQNSFIDFMK